MQSHPIDLSSPYLNKILVPFSLLSHLNFGPFPPLLQPATQATRTRIHKRIASQIQLKISIPYFQFWLDFFTVNVFLRLTVKILSFLRLTATFLAVLRLTVNPIETLEVVKASTLTALRVVNLNVNKAQFRRRTFHEPNLIRIWTDPN